MVITVIYLYAMQCIPLVVIPSLCVNASTISSRNSRVKLETFLVHEPAVSLVTDNSVTIGKIIRILARGKFIDHHHELYSCAMSIWSLPISTDELSCDQSSPIFSVFTCAIAKKRLPCTGNVWRGKILANHVNRIYWREKIWRINNSQCIFHIRFSCI